MKTPTTPSNDITPQDKTNYKLGDTSENGHKIEGIFGSSPQVIVFLTQDNFIRWEISDDNPPTHYKRAVEEFDKIDSQINNSITFKKVKSNLDKDLGRALFNAINSDDEDKAVSNFEEIAQRISAQIEFHSKLLYVGGSLVLWLILGLLITVFHVCYIRDSSNLPNLINSNLYELILGFGAGSTGALISVLSTVKNTNIPLNSTPIEHLFWGAARIILGAISGSALIMLIAGNVVLDLASDSLNTKISFAIAAGFSERYLGKQLQSLTDK